MFHVKHPRPRRTGHPRSGPRSAPRFHVEPPGSPDAARTRGREGRERGARVAGLTRAATPACPRSRGRTRQWPPRGIGGPRGSAPPGTGELRARAAGELPTGPRSRGKVRPLAIAPAIEAGGGRERHRRASGGHAGVGETRAPRARAGGEQGLAPREAARGTTEPRRGWNQFAVQTPGDLTYHDPPTTMPTDDRGAAPIRWPSRSAVPASAASGRGHLPTRGRVHPPRRLSPLAHKIPGRPTRFSRTTLV